MERSHHLDEKNNVDPDQLASEASWSGSTLFQWRPWSAGFWGSQLIWIYTVFTTGHRVLKNIKGTMQLLGPIWQINWAVSWNWMSLDPMLYGKNVNVLFKMKSSVVGNPKYFFYCCDISCSSEIQSKVVFHGCSHHILKKINIAALWYSTTSIT